MKNSVTLALCFVVSFVLPTPTHGNEADTGAVGECAEYVIWSYDTGG